MWRQSWPRLWACSRRTVSRAPCTSTAGVSRDTAAVVGAWGAEVCVVGSALFQRGRDTADEVRLVRERIWEGRRSGPATMAALAPRAVGIDARVAASDQR